MEEQARKMSVSEYLALDADADGRLELLNGIVVAMAGASPRHNRIVTNVVHALETGFAGGPCMAFTQDQRVWIEATESFVYPDVVVMCEEPDFDTSARPASLRNPSALVEVLSESTLDHDLGAKLGHYRRIVSVREVLFVHVETHAVTLVTREDDGSWKLIDRGPEGKIELSGVVLPLDTLYDRADSLPA